MMTRRLLPLTAAVLLIAACAGAQDNQTNDPFPQPIEATAGVIAVSVAEFATIPGVDGQPPRMMLLAQEPGGTRLFVNDMRGPLYGVSRDGQAVTLYLDIDAARWGVSVQSQNNERGFQSFAFHPQFNQAGTPGFGKFYTYTDTTNMTPAPDFTAAGAANATHDTVLLEWTAKTPGGPAYDGGAPRELIRIRQPFGNHNAGHLAFNPLAAPGSPEFGLLYMGIADGGSGGDPLNLAQNMGSAFGKIFRIDPLGTNSRNGKYGIPNGNPFVTAGGALPEIYAYGARNPQRLGWDAKTGALYMADIGQNIVEEISPVPAGANLGWNTWEGSFRFVSRQAVSTENPRGDARAVFPVVEYGQVDPLLQNSSAATGVIVYRDTRLPRLANLLIFGDNPSGEVFYVSADNLPNGGQDAIRRILFTSNGERKTLLQLIQAKNTAQGQKPAPRADLRFGTGDGGRIFLLNKRDGVIREIVP